MRNGNKFAPRNAMLIFDEKLADILDDEGNARRGWMMELRRQEAEQYAHIEQLVNAVELVAV